MLQLTFLSLAPADIQQKHAYELRNKKIQYSVNPHFGVDELAEEVGC